MGRREKTPIDQKVCAGCGDKNPTPRSYCLKCMSAVQSVRFNGWAHYNKIENWERKEALIFIEKVKSQKGFLTMIDTFLVIHYYQLTHRLQLKYHRYSTDRQLWYFFCDLLIWSSKQKGNNLPFNKMSRQDIYKTLMIKDANK